MADNEAAPPAEAPAAPEETEAKEQEFAYTFKVEDVGPGTKKVSVEIPEDRIAEKLAEQFKELRQQANIPGFRLGHAPQKLIERRFNNDVREQVRRNLVSESYQQALEKSSLQVLGDPEFENAEAIKLPESGPLNYSFSVEVRPDIKLPELKGLRLKKPKVRVGDTDVEQALRYLREQQGVLVPVEGRGVEARDHLIADVHAKVDGNVVAHEHDAQIVARAGRLAGIPIDDLDERLKGLTVGQNRTFTVKAPDTHPDEALRGKDVQIDVALKELKEVELVKIDHDFLDHLGFANEQELRDALRGQLVQRLGDDVKQVMRDQVCRYLLEQVKLELPAKLSDRQTERVVGRRAVSMVMRGVPREEVETNLEQMRGGAKEEAIRELKLLFILQQASAEFKIDVSESELNQAVASVAIQRGRRPEKMKQEMGKDGSLSNLYLQLREDKTLDRIIELGEIEEVDVPAEAAPKQGT